MKYLLFFIGCIMCFSFQAEQVETSLNRGNYLEFKAGHNSDDCDGKGEPMIAFDALIEMHLPCQGFGNECSYKVKIDLITTKNLPSALSSHDKYDIVIYFGDAYSEDEFIMPKRSIYSKFDGKYVNIPFRIMKKMSGSQGYYYLAKGVTFSDKALYNNK